MRIPYWICSLWMLALLVGCSQHPPDFYRICQLGTVEQVRAALANGANPLAVDANGATPLLWAVRANPDPEVVRVLMEAGADLTAQTQHGLTAQAIAAYNPNERMMDFILHQGFDPNVPNEDFGPPLLIASMVNPNPKVIQVLLDAGASLDVGEPHYTPLMAAAMANPSVEVIRLLLDQGGDLHAKREGGQTALLFAACWNRNPEVITTLIQAGASLQDKDDSGLTPLASAAMFNMNRGIVTALVKAGADPNEVSGPSGKKVLELAKQFNNRPARKELVQAGAQ